MLKSLEKLDSVWRLSGKYKFEGCKKDTNVLFYILAGYKEILWDIVFERVFQFIPQNIDICILSSGMYSTKLNDICKKYNWSYLSTKRNNLTSAQNILIHKFSSAQWIYKIDEDIFVTKNFYQTMMDTYLAIEKNSKCRIGFVGPIIPLNSYGTTALLEKLELEDYYAEKFERSQYGWRTDLHYYSNPEVAKFFWGKGGIIPQIDVLDDQLHTNNFEYSVCPVMFNIGAILFKRDYWKDIKMFRVGLGNDLGKDEERLCLMSMKRSRPIFVSNNTAVGHLAFTPQTKEMINYYHKHKECFEIKG